VLRAIANLPYANGVARPACGTTAAL
jgi:hypothetical protein